MRIFSFLVIGLLISHLSFSQSQYFGQNKPRYKPFNFKVLQSPHFELYHYSKDNSVPTELLINSEHWYKMHQEVFKLAFIKPNPLIIYQNHPDFQETTAIGGQIGEGTGGVTEGLRNRVVMPIMYSKRQTDHVLGHELVHAFQYQLMTTGDSKQLGNIQNLPLFMVEGLAEYMSLGRVDAHTAMWLRDALLSNDIPSIKDLVTKEYKYFPYRWGQAFWAYLTATYGDDIIRPLFRETAIYGFEQAFSRNLKMTSDQVSAKWKQALIDAYTPLKSSTSSTAIGKAIASQSSDGDMNISPSISHDGKFLAYISSKNVISLDIFIIELASGKLIRKIESTSLGGHVDAYNFLETSGTWSPDNRKFAIVIQSKGRNKLAIVDVANGNKDIVEIKGLDAFSNPSWSPNGQSIVVSGLQNGNSDLYLYELKSKEVSNLSNDDFANLQPSWSADGEWIYFATDANANKLRLEKANYSIARFNISSRKTEHFNFLAEADNLNPVIDPSGNMLYFLSDADGFRDLYSYNIGEKKVEKLTNYFTGISGITMYSPALTMATKTGALVYNYFKNGKYSLYLANRADFTPKEFPNKVDKLNATLPPIDFKDGRNIIQNNLEKQTFVSKISDKKLQALAYKPKFKLDYLGSSGVGVSASRWGTGLGGGVIGLFSDMLNNNQLSAVASLNGDIEDFGGQVQYLNQKKPLQWGASLSRIPYRFSSSKTSIIDNIDLKEKYKLNLKDTLVKSISNLYRINNTEIGLFAVYPISIIQRLEIGANTSWYSYNGKKYVDYYQLENRKTYNLGSEIPQKISKSHLDSIGYSPFNIQRLYTAYVGDNTTFGLTAPLNGYRYRFEFARYFGDYAHNSVTLDYRKYKYFKPFSVSTRLFYHGKFNAKDSTSYDRIYPVFLGYPWYIHGMWGGSLSKQVALKKISEQQLMGTQMALINFEIRLPFTGPKKLALINFEYVPSDLNFFFDAGMAWDDVRKPGKEYAYNLSDGNTLTQKLKPIVSTGLSLRINAMGYLIIEPYLAFLIYNGKPQPAVTGVNLLVPGW